MEHIWEASTTRTRTPPDAERLIPFWSCDSLHAARSISMFRSLFRISLKEAPTFSTRRDQHLSVISARSRGWRWQDGKRLPSAQDQVIIWPNDVRTHQKMFGPLGIFSICPKDWMKLAMDNVICLFMSSQLQPFRCHWSSTSNLFGWPAPCTMVRGTQGIKAWNFIRHPDIENKTNGLAKPRKRRTRKLKGTVTYSHHFTILFHLNPVEFGDGEVCIDLGCQINLSGMPAWLLHWWFSFPCQPPCPQFWVRKAMKDVWPGLVQTKDLAIYPIARKLA